MANCYWPGGGKEGQFPSNFGQCTKANIASLPSCDKTEHFILSAQTSNIGQASTGDIVTEIIFEDDDEEVIIDAEISLISGNFVSFNTEGISTFMDSGASDTMFVSRSAFVEYQPTAIWTRDSAKALDGSFEIIGEGKVTQCCLVDGKEKRITYTHALHTPTLNANLISISAFDRAGLTTTFGGGRGIIRKADRTAVLTGRGERGMYVVDTLDEKHGNRTTHPMAMSSLSQPEQWHR
jgi:hypothetical protein